jgi:hypothetical protein
MAQRIRTIDEIAKAYAENSNEQGRMADAIRQAFEECPPSTLEENQIVLTLEPADPRGLYLRTAWATGTTASGKEFEVAQSGVTLVLTLGNFTDGERTVDEVPLENLVRAWLTMRGEK